MIYTLTLNPAVDRELTVPEIQFDSVLRASKSRVDLGGKGFNVSRLLRQMGMESRALGFVGGHAGELLRDGLEGLGIATDFVWVRGETRTNISVVTGSHDRYVKVNEAGPVVDQVKQRELLEKIDSLARAGDWWIMAGSLPPGPGAGFYAAVIRLLRQHGSKAVVDTSGEALRLACEAGPYVVKPNAEEAAVLTSLPANSPLEVAAAAGRMRGMGAAIAVISMGKGGALLLSDAGTWLARPPQINQKNPIGAGDSLVGGLVWALSQGFSEPEALGWGVAAGAATASLSGTGVGSMPLIKELRQAVRYEQPDIQQ